MDILTLGIFHTLSQWETKGVLLSALNTVELTEEIMQGRRDLRDFRKIISSSSIYSTMTTQGR